ncbi:MAG TPA: hypothetical protein VM925_16845 [Labilithrix sp.]|nr:hypothetical protein [Labilithrix sp.]
MNRRVTVAAFLLAVSIGASPLACNVFVSIDRCKGTEDCPSGHICDLEGRFCVDQRGETGPVVDASPETSGETDATYADVAVDAPDAAACNLAAPFESVTLVPGLELGDVLTARLTSDEKTLLFSAYSGCKLESCIDLWVASRPNRTSPFVVQGTLPGVNTEKASEYWPTMTEDRLLLFMESGRSLQKVDGGYVSDRSRIWSTTRNNETAQFGEPAIQDIFIVPETEYEASPYLHPNGKSLYFASTTRAGNKGGLDIFVAQLGNFGIASSVSNVGGVNTENNELMPLISRDERALYFARDVGFERQIMVSTRSAATGPFGAPTPVSELNQGYDWPSWLSDDQCRLYFVSTRSLAQDGGNFGAYRLWMAERPK